MPLRVPYSVRAIFVCRFRDAMYSKKTGILLFFQGYTPSTSLALGGLLELAPKCKLFTTSIQVI